MCASSQSTTYFISAGLSAQYSAFQGVLWHKLIIIVWIIELIQRPSLTLVFPLTKRDRQQKSHYQCFLLGKRESENSMYSVQFRTVIYMLTKGVHDQQSRAARQTAQIITQCLMSCLLSGIQTNILARSSVVLLIHKSSWNQRRHIYYTFFLPHRPKLHTDLTDIFTYDT